MRELIKDLWGRLEEGHKSLSHIDWKMFFCALLLSAAGLVTMNSFLPEGNPQAQIADHFFGRQSLWIVISVVVFFVAANIDWRFLRRTSVIVALFSFSVALLLLLFVVGKAVHGAQSWFNLGGFSFQPSDPVKLVLLLLLSKYFSRRHVEIANVRHILTSGLYAFILFILVLIQPDFGSAIIIFLIWLGMVLVSGISKRHLAAVILSVIIGFSVMWSLVLAPYQKQRIVTFINPLTDIHGAGYNAYQSTIAVGSGEILGKGIGYGTQSKLKFLPEYETDFIFAAFAEEWGFVGVSVIFVLFGFLISRILKEAMRGGSNFETFFGLGVAIFFMTHLIIHIGMNLGVLPITGTTLPFMSYGGSHLATEFLALGILMGMRKYSIATHKEAIEQEIPGIE